MAAITAKWLKLAASPQLQRSSHTLTTLGSTLYLFGGELIARKPRDNDLHTIKINKQDAQDTTVALSTQSPSPAPSPRVGAATAKIGNTMYLFSGRGGEAMAPVDEKGALWALELDSGGAGRWKLIQPSGQVFPEARSYHAMASDGKGLVFVHAGCPEKGRLADLWAFDVRTAVWKELKPAPGPARGGCSVAFAEGKLYRMNGFDGQTEQGGVLDVYDLKSDGWSSIKYGADGKSGPGARSVAALLPVMIDGGMSLVTLFGESDPSNLGHQGAGKMLRDVWAFSIANSTWSQVSTEGSVSPEARGWFDADVFMLDGRNGIVVCGGLGESNERLDDVWSLNF